MIQQAIDFVRQVQGTEGAHDKHHVMRVWNTAKSIAQKEGCDLLIVELAALLHDVDDWKFTDNKNKTKEFLDSLDLGQKQKSHILQIIGEISFKGAQMKSIPSTVEGRVVQDADRLDAIGAVGIARCFAYGGHKGNVLYDPGSRPEQHASFEDYKKNSNNSFNHFYEKLLLLKNLMNTKEGKKLAEERHRFMELFLDQFTREALASEKDVKELVRPSKSPES